MVACFAVTPILTAIVRRLLIIILYIFSVLLFAQAAHAQSNTLTLSKIWVNGKPGDCVSLQIDGGRGATPGSSTVGGVSVDAIARTSSGNRITISENFIVGDANNYDVSFSCWRNSNGANVPLTGSGLSRSLIISSGSGVSCTITNSRKPVSLTLRKQWVNASVGNAVTVSTNGYLNNGNFNSVANMANEIDTGGAFTVYAGGVGQIIEDFTNGSAVNYFSSLSCTGNTNALSGTTLTIHHNDIAIICTYTNRLRVAMTMTKTSAVISDPVNGSTNPKMIPGAFVDYTLTINNPASYSIDSDSIIAMDQLPGPINLYVLPISPEVGPG